MIDCLAVHSFNIVATALLLFANTCFLTFDRNVYAFVHIWLIEGSNMHGQSWLS